MQNTKTENYAQLYKVKQTVETKEFLYRTVVLAWRLSSFDRSWDESCVSNVFRVWRRSELARY